MGQCYSVILHYKLIDTDGAIKALNEKIVADEGKVRYNTEGLNINTVPGIMNVFLTMNAKVLPQDDEWFDIVSDFDASYGWEIVLCDFFHVLACYCYPGSYIDIYPDEGAYRIIWDGFTLSEEDIKTPEELATAQQYLDYVLQDDASEYGGISHADETLREFLDETDMPYDSNMKDINEALVECGIEPIEVD